MKSIVTLFLLIASIAALCARPDRQFTPAELEAIHNALPDKAYVTPQKPRKILIFSRTPGYRHIEGIPALKEAFSRMGEQTGAWETVISDDLANFEPEKLAQFDCVVMNNTTAAPFGENIAEMAKMPEQERKEIIERDRRLRGNLVEYVANGGGLVAIHAGADTYGPKLKELAGPDYVDMIGAVFRSHPWTVSNAPVTLVIDDMDSALTKGIWQVDEFAINDEIYMFGDEFDRSKLRVLMGLDVGRSPITTGRNPRIREDGDIALVWIKTHGEGRVFYGALGHLWTVFTNPEIMELYMRGIQFAIGDLPADTTPLPFVPRTRTHAVLPSLYRTPSVKAPTRAEILAQRNSQYGEHTQALNELFFGVAANNRSAEYCREIEGLVIDELRSKQGTERYRTLLAWLLYNVRIQDRIDEVEALYQSDPNSSVGSILEGAIAHYKNKGFSYGFVYESVAPLVPPQKPDSEREVFNLIGKLQSNPSLAIPPYLTLDNLDGQAKVRLIYLLVDRKMALEEIFALEPTDPEIALAVAYAAGKAGDASHRDKILAMADIVPPQSHGALVMYLQMIPAEGRAQWAVSRQPEVRGRQAQLLNRLMATIDLNPAMPKIYAGLTSSDIAVRRASLQTLAGIGDLDAFKRILAAYGKESDASIRSMMEGVMKRIASREPDDQVHAAVREGLASEKGDAGAFLLGFTSEISTPEALETCLRALDGENRAQALEQLGKWKDGSAQSALLYAMRSAKSPQEQEQIANAIVLLAEKFGPTQETLELAINGTNPAIQERVVDAALKRSPADVLTLLKKYPQYSERADAALRSLRESKPTMSASHNGKDVGQMLAGNSRWTTRKAITPGMWVQADFGEPRRVSSITMILAAAAKNDAPSEIQVLAGNSENALLPVAFEYSVVSGKDRKIVFPDPITARFIKIIAEKPSAVTRSWWSIYEWQTQS